jgi:hypothetical protein
MGFFLQPFFHFFFFFIFFFALDLLHVSLTLQEINLWSFSWCQEKLHEVFPTTILPFFLVLRLFLLH